MQISDRVYMVGSGRFGHELTDSKDCNVYLLDGGGEYALIDAGSGIAPEKIVERIAQCGVSMDQITYLLLTHVHGDHAAGAYYFREKYGMKVVVSKEAASWLEQGDMEKTSLHVAQRAGVYPADFQFPACPVDIQVSEHDLLTVGELQLRVIDTPGHSRGHVSYLFQEDGQYSLFAGDTVFAGGRIVIQYIWDCSIQDYAETIAKLHSLQIDHLYPGHAAFVRNKAAEHIETAHNYFLRLEIPPNL